MALPQPVTLPQPRRKQNHDTALRLLEAADALDEAIAEEKDPKRIEALSRQADRLVAKAHVRAVLSTVDRTISQ